jgi:antitoxin VapB
MDLSIEDPEAQRLAQLLANETGETITAAVIQALRERLDRIRNERDRQALLRDLTEIEKSAYDAAKRRALARKLFPKSDGRYLAREDRHDRARLR